MNINESINSFKDTEFRERQNLISGQAVNETRCLERGSLGTPEMGSGSQGGDRLSMKINLVEHFP
jgi:hypothetical protein